MTRANFQRPAVVVVVVGVLTVCVPAARALAADLAAGHHARRPRTHILLLKQTATALATSSKDEIENASPLAYLDLRLLRCLALLRGVGLRLGLRELVGAGLD